MTDNPTPEAAMVEVTQADRELLAALQPRFADDILAGDCDEVNDMQLIARHRLSALQSAPPPVTGGERALREENERLRADIRHIQRNTATYRQEARKEADAANARAAQANKRADDIVEANRRLIAAFEAPATPATGGTFADGVEARKVKRQWEAACARHTQLLEKHPATDLVVKRSGERCAALYARLSDLAIRALRPGAGREEGV